MTASRRRRGPRREIVALVLLACLAGATVSGQTNTDTRKKRVLALFLGRRDAPGFAQADDAFREELERGLAGRLDYVTEYVDLVASPTTTAGDAVRAAVRTRTREQPFDLIAASSPAGVDIPDDVASVFPDVPVVVTATRSVPAQPGMTGVISDVDFGSTLAAAFALRPGIKQVFVVSGTAPFDRSLLRHFTSHVGTFATKVTFTELVGLSVPDLKQRLERAATDVIVYYLTVSEDGGGRPLAPFSTLGEIAAVSAAPVFSWHESTLGLGVVGGRLHSSADDGRASARVALRILGGDGVASVPVASVDSHLNAFDWRAMQRWGLDEARLPSGGEIRFRRESFFARNRGYVTASLLLLAAQALLIGGLLVQRARRRRAEERNTAILRSVPDLMFVLNREGMYLDFHAHRQEELFAPPHVFLNRTIRQVMPGPLAEMFMDALERSLDGQEPVIVEYELPLPGAVRYFEARLVPAGDGTVLSMVRDVTDSHRAHELNRKLAGRLIATQEEERHRIARELHDDLGQKVALLNIEVSEISRKMEGRGQQAALERLTEQAADIARDLRALSHELHPSHLDIVGLVASIRSLCAEVAQKCECQVTFSAGDVTNPIDPNVALCLYRVTQEALHNVAKHSRATRACVRLTQGPADLHLQIDDNGIGFDAAAAPAGLGLASMRERVAIFDGSFVIQRGPEGGTRVDVRVPTTAPN